MIERYEGSDGVSRLIEAFRSQHIIQGDKELATELSSAVQLKELKKNDVLIKEGDSENSLYFIISGRAAILVNGRKIAYRQTGDHVGEMALIDSAARRSATVVMEEETVVAQITESAFTDIANRNPRLWRLIAVELCNRLRQRNELVRNVNQIPMLFIGSSVESLPIAREIQDGLQHDVIEVKIWTDKLFGASNYPIDDLEELLNSSDFALLVIGPDDKVISRAVKSDAPRDNVIFELGMSMGALSRKRTFILTPRSVDIKIPSDLLGLTPLSYPEGTDDDLSSRLGPACNELRKIINKLGRR